MCQNLQGYLLKKNEAYYRRTQTMQIIKIECPSCGATPEVNKDLEFGYCMYCGTKIYIPNAVQKIRGTVSIDKSSETENLLKRAGQYEAAGDLEKAGEYYERVLDMDADNETAHQRRAGLQILIARQYERERNISMAEQTLQMALRLYPANEALRSEMHRVTHTIYSPNVTIINRTNNKKPVFEKMEDGSMSRVVDLLKDYESRAELSFPVGKHTIIAGKVNNQYEFTIESNKTRIVVILEPKMFGCVFKEADKTMIRAQVKKKDPNRLYCQKCGSDDIFIQMIETGTKTVKDGIGAAGQINNLARGVTAIGTLGMSNIVWKKSKPRHHHEILSKKICICQNCGRSWEMKN